MPNTCDNYRWHPAQKEFVYWPILPIHSLHCQMHVSHRSKLQVLVISEQDQQVTLRADIIFLQPAQTPTDLSYVAQQPRWRRPRNASKPPSASDIEAICHDLAYQIESCLSTHRSCARQTCLVPITHRYYKKCRNNLNSLPGKRHDCIGAVSG